MRIFLAIVVVVAFAACKARNHADAGLLDSKQQFAATTSEFDVHCVGVEQDAASLAYDLKVAAGTAFDTLTVEIAKVQGATSTVINVDSTATGAVSESGALNVAFTGGVLSADKAMEDKAHVGVLTVFGDPDADALDVRCLVALRDPRG